LFWGRGKKLRRVVLIRGYRGRKVRRLLLAPFRQLIHQLVVVHFPLRQLLRTFGHGTRFRTAAEDVVIWQTLVVGRGAFGLDVDTDELRAGGRWSAGIPLGTRPLGILPEVAKGIVEGILEAGPLVPREVRIGIEGVLFHLNTTLRKIARTSISMFLVGGVVIAVRSALPTTVPSPGTGRCTGTTTLALATTGVGNGKWRQPLLAGRSLITRRLRSRHAQARRSGIRTGKVVSARKVGPIGTDGRTDEFHGPAETMTLGQDVKPVHGLGGRNELGAAAALGLLGSGSTAVAIVVVVATPSADPPKATPLPKRPTFEPILLLVRGRVGRERNDGLLFHADALGEYGGHDGFTGVGAAPSDGLVRASRRRAAGDHIINIAGPSSVLLVLAVLRSIGPALPVPFPRRVPLEEARGARHRPSLLLSVRPWLFRLVPNNVSISIGVGDGRLTTFAASPPPPPLLHMETKLLLRESRSLLVGRYVLAFDQPAPLLSLIGCISRIRGSSGGAEDKEEGHRQE